MIKPSNQRRMTLRQVLRVLPVLFVAALNGWAAQAAELTVSAASSLTNAFREIAPLFEAAHPGTKLQLNFGGSGALLQQIARGAPVDVYASADQTRMDQAAKDRLVRSEKRQNFVSNALVVIVPASVTDPARVPATLDALTAPAFARIAIGLPASVPVGSYTKLVLEAADLWRAIEPRMIGAGNVRQALDYVARAEVDAGFVYATDAALMPARVKVALTVTTPAPILYPVAPVAKSAQPELAEQFVAFLATPPAREVFARHGFGAP